MTGGSALLTEKGVGRRKSRASRLEPLHLSLSSSRYPAGFSLIRCSACCLCAVISDGPDQQSVTLYRNAAESAEP
jgi:hypothetical protein